MAFSVVLNYPQFVFKAELVEAPNAFLEASGQVERLDRHRQRVEERLRALLIDVPAIPAAPTKFAWSPIHLSTTNLSIFKR